MAKQKIRTIIVDDEPAAREGMVLMLKGFNDIEIVASCRNGIEAIQEIREKNPDLLLLDIQMPGIDGFDVLNNIPEKKRPYIVFITAYDQFAVKAFEYHALDYLLKPYSDERFVEMINRIKDHIYQQKTISQLQKVDVLSRELLDKRKNESDLMILPYEGETGVEESRLVVKEGGKIHLIPMKRITFIEAYDYYAKIHTTDTFILVRIPLKVMENQLPENQFIRIHRSYILNLLYLKRIEKNDSGDYNAVLITGNSLKVSNTYKNDLIEKLNTL